MKSRMPDAIYEQITDITVEELKRRGVKGLILDVDNTLTPSGHQEVTTAVREWLNLLKAHYIKLAVVSNNKRSRVEPFAQRIGVMYFWRACKPLRFGFRRAQRMFGLKSAEIAVVGDQIYTDIYGAHRSGMQALMVQPLHMEDGPFFRLKRKMEQKHIALFWEQNKVKTEINAREQDDLPQ